MAIQFFQEEDQGSSVHVVDDPILVEQAKTALAARTAVAENQLKEDTAKDKLSAAGLGIALSDIDDKVYTGTVRVTCPDESPVRIEMRLTKGAMRVTEEDRLGEAFGPLYTEFFERAHDIQKIIDPDGLIQALRKDKINPWKHLKIEVRTGSEEVVAKYKQAVISQEAIVPVKGFFTKLNEYSTKLKAKAVNFLKEYLPQAIEPSVILGTRGRK